MNILLFKYSKSLIYSSVIFVMLTWILYIPMFHQNLVPSIQNVKRQILIIVVLLFIHTKSFILHDGCTLVRYSVASKIQFSLLLAVDLILFAS